MKADEVRDALKGLTVPVEVAGKAVGLSRDASYRAVRNGDIPSLRIGGKIVVPTAPLRRMLGLDTSEAA